MATKKKADPPKSEEAVAVEATIMEHAAQSAVDGYEAIGAMNLAPEDATAVRAEYFRSLDLAAAMRRAEELKAERERIAAFEAERAQAAPEPAPEPAPAPAIHPPVHEDEATTWATSTETNPQVQVETTPAPAPTPAESVAQTAAVKPGETVPPIALVAYVTEAQRAGLVAYCKEHGIRGFFKATHGHRIDVTLKED